MIEHERIVIVGAGHVGATAAYALMLRALFEEIVLIDSDLALAEAEAADLSDANALARPARIWAGSYADAATARIAVITAGAATHGSESRLSVASQSAMIVTTCVGELVQAGFAGIILVAANPVDVMTLMALRRSGFASAKVIGTGTLLDTSRLKQTLAESLQVTPGSIDGLVLGEHGDSEGSSVLDRSCRRVAAERILSAGAGTRPGPDRHGGARRRLPNCPGQGLHILRGGDRDRADMRGDLAQ